MRTTTVKVYRILFTDSNCVSSEYYMTKAEAMQSFFYRHSTRNIIITEEMEIAI